MTISRRAMRKRNLVVLVALAASVPACSRDELVSVVPGDAPGRSAATLESRLGPDDVTRWIDTVFSGFGDASAATFILAETGSPDLTSRGLFLFRAPVQDSVFRFDTASVAQSFDSLRVILSVDTSRSRVASTGTTLQIRAVSDEWDVRSATWDLAVDSPGVATPWTAGPGGSLGDVLSEVKLVVDTINTLPDSIVFDLTPYSDSLLLAWNDTTQVNKGLSVVVADSGQFVLGIPRLQYNIIPELDPDTAVPVRCPSLTSLLYCFPRKTYIYNLASIQPAVGTLRIGAVDAWRSFTELVIPDSVTVAGSTQKRVIRQATINQAELIITSLESQGPPLWAEDSFDATVVRVNDDFTILGPKTPVGNEVVSAIFNVDIDSLQAGSTIRLDITNLVQEWAAVPIDSVAPPIRFVLRARPEGTTFGYWEFGAADGPPEYRPVLRIVFTPDTEFAFP